MEFQPLTQLRTKLNKDVPTAVVDKLNFLWRAATACLEREPVVVSSSSHRLCQSFVETASQHNVDIPKTVSDRLCGYCSVLLVPAVTCQVRVRERTRLSRVNRAKKDRLKNQVVLKCTLCSHNSKLSGYMRKNKIAAQNAPTVAVASQSKEAASSAQASKAAGALPLEKKKFSFLNRLQGPAVGTTSTNTFDRRASAPGKLDSDFISFSSSAASTAQSKLTPSTASSLQALSTGILGGAKRDAGQIGSWKGTSSLKPALAAPPSGTLNLLELEALNKKKRRKSLGPNSN